MQTDDCVDNGTGLGIKGSFCTAINDSYQGLITLTVFSNRKQAKL